MRDKDKSILRMNHLENPFMLIAFFLGLALQVLVTEVQFLVEAFGTAKLSFSQWRLLLGISAVPLVTHELLLLPRKLLGMGRKQ